MSGKARRRFVDALLNSPVGTAQRVIGDQFVGLASAEERAWFLDHMIDHYLPGSCEHEIVAQLRDLYAGRVSP